MSSNIVILKNFSALSAAQALSMAAGIGSTVWLARHLGPDQFGLLGFGVALLTYFLVASNLGTDALAARDIARDRAAAVGVTSKTLGLRLVLASAAYIGYAGLVFIIRGAPDERMVLLTQGTVLFATALTIEFMYQGIERMGVNALRQVVQALLILFGAVLLVETPEDVGSAAFLTPVAAFLTALGLLYFARREHPGLGVTFDHAQWSARLKAASPFALTTLMHSVLLSFDVVMIGLLLDDAAVGLYAAALKLMLLVMIPAGMLTSAWYPVLARSFGKPADMQREGDTYARFTLAFGVPAAVIGAIFAPSAVTGLFGPAFAEAGIIASLLMIVSGLMHLHIAFCTALPAWNRERAHAGTYVLGAGINIAANFVLIPLYGGIGAAIASLISYAAVALAAAYYYRQTAEALPWRALGAATAAAFAILPVAGVMAWVLQDRLPALWIAGIGAGLSFVVFLGIARVCGLLPAAAWTFIETRILPGRKNG